jgi:hypothetical protein
LSILVEFAGGWRRHAEEEGEEGEEGEEERELRSTMSSRNSTYPRLLGMYATSLVDEIATSLGYGNTRFLIESHLDFLLLRWLSYAKLKSMRGGGRRRNGKIGSSDTFLDGFPIHLCGEWCSSMKAFVELVAPSLFPIVILQAAWEETDADGGQASTDLASSFRWGRIKKMTRILR